MKRIILLLVLLLYITSNLLQAQVNNKFNQCQIVNSELAIAIKNVIDSSLKCPYFSVLRNPFLVNVVFYDNDFIGVSVLPYSITRLSNSILFSKGKTFGAGMIGDIYFYVTNCTSSDSILCRFLKRNKTTIRFPNIVSHNIRDQHVIFVQHVTIYYNINGEKLEHDSEDMELCNNFCGFSYLVTKKDTWKTIAKKSHCPIQILKDAYPNMRKPIEGYLIDFQYLFDEKGLKDIEPAL